MSAHPPKKRKRRIDKLRIDETSVVDKPAQTPARIAILKRAADTSSVKIQKKLAMTNAVDGHQHTIVLVQAHSEGLSEVRAGTSSFVNGHTHDFITDESGNIMLAESEGHTHLIAALITKVSDDSDESLIEGVSASLDHNPTQADIQKAADSGVESTMTPEEKAAFEKAAEDKLTIEKARADRAESILELSPPERLYFGALDTAGQEEFLTKSNDEKTAILKNRADENPVVHTDLDGNEIRKNEGPTVLRLAKSNDELRKNAAKSDAIAKQAGFEKRANDELSHLSGEVSVKANLLKAVATLPEDEQEAALAILKSKDAGMEKAFQTIGTSDDGNGEGADAEAKIMTIAKSLRESNPKLSPEQAYVAALDTPEGLKLHAQL